MKHLAISLLFCCLWPTLSRGETSLRQAAEPALPEMPEGWNALPRGRPFGVLPSDPRDLKLGLRKNSNRELEADVGGYRSLAGWRGEIAGETTALHTGIEGNGYFQMRQEGSKFPLLSSDGLVGVYAEAARGPMAYQVRYTHISAHLSDGLFGLRSPILYTREFLALRAARDLGFARAYAGYQLLTHTAPTLPRHSFQLGAYSYLPWRWGSICPYVGADLRLRNASEGTTYQLGAGAALLSAQGAPPVRFTASYLKGHDLRGQFYGDSVSKWAFGLDLEI